MATLRQTIGNILHAQPLNKGHASFYLFQVADRERNAVKGLTDQDHLEAAAKWLEAAQDSQSDGGFSGRYKLNLGWTSSYPETTGYLIPTCLELAKRGEPKWKERAKTAIDFLTNLQLESGAFPGGEVAENTTEPSPFNTAQILNGYTAWIQETQDPAAIETARKAVDWLISVQDEDGAFRKYYYENQPAAYAAHLSCWVAEYGAAFAYEPAKIAAGKHLDWTLAQQDPETGWFHGSGFTKEDHEKGESVTHTIAYTIWGVLLMGIWLDREDAIDAAEKAAYGMLQRLELSKLLPGFLNKEWKMVQRPQCLTGNAQMALVWMKLYELRCDARFLNGALKAIDLIKRAQDMSNPNPGIRGGVAGSDPVWGNYLFHALPNWAAKFFIDALFEKPKMLSLAAERADNAQ